MNPLKRDPSPPLPPMHHLGRLPTRDLLLPSRFLFLPFSRGSIAIDVFEVW